MWWHSDTVLYTISSNAELCTMHRRNKRINKFWKNAQKWEVHVLALIYNFFFRFTYKYKNILFSVLYFFLVHFESKQFFLFPFVSVTNN